MEYSRNMKARKLILFLLVLVVSSGVLFASDWNFVFGDLTQNTEILWGFCPSYFYGGVAYEGVEILEGHKTSFQFLIGAGYSNRRVWQNPVTGEVMNNQNPLIFNLIDTDWAIRFSQGFYTNPLNPKKDLVTLSFGYEGQYEQAQNSLKVGKKDEVVSIDDYFKKYTGSAVYEGDIYPELRGDRKFLGTQFFLNLKLDSMIDDIHRNDGALANIKAMWGPRSLNESMDGEADYFSMNGNLVLSYTLYSYATEKVRWFSITALNRTNLNYTTGNQVPLFIQGPASLGRKVRGFNTYTYNTEFTFVNNTDLRLAGPDMGLKGLCPRINFFYDIGLGWGNILNTKISSKMNVLSSTGVQATLTIFDFIDLGYQVAFLLSGENYAESLKKPGEKVSMAGSVTFFLDF